MQNWYALKAHDVMIFALQADTFARWWSLRTTPFPSHLIVPDDKIVRATFFGGLERPLAQDFARCVPHPPFQYEIRECVNRSAF